MTTSPIGFGEDEKVEWATLERQKAIYERALKIFDLDYGSDADKLQFSKLMTVLEPRMSSRTYEDTVNRMGSWTEAVEIVGRMDWLIGAAHKGSFSAKHGSAQHQHTGTDVEQSNSIPAGTHMHLPMFEHLRASIPERARFHASSKVLPEMLPQQGESVAYTPHISRWAFPEVAQSVETKPVRAGEPLVTTGDKSSEQLLFRHVHMFDRLSSSDKVPVAMLMFERWLESVEASQALSTYDREPAQAMRKLLHGFKKYYKSRKPPLRFDNGYLSMAVAGEFGRLLHWDKRVVMQADIQHWKYKADKYLSRHLSRFDAIARKVWAHDWSKNCATKVKS